MGQVCPKCGRNDGYRKTCINGHYFCSKCSKAGLLGQECPYSDCRGTAMNDD